MIVDLLSADQLTNPAMVRGADFVVGWNADHGDFVLAGEKAYRRHLELSTREWLADKQSRPHGLRLLASPHDGTLDLAIEAVRRWQSLRSELGLGASSAALPARPVLDRPRSR